MKKFAVTLCTLVLAGISAHAAETLKIDPSASEVKFSIMNKPPNESEFSEVTGSFKDFSGTVELDEANPSASSIHFEVRTASVDTANQKRDDHLRNQDFFKVKEFPVMTFKSKSVKPLGDDKYEVAGDFTLLGKSKELMVTVEKAGERTASTKFRIKRSEFGMNYRVPETADEVDVSLKLVAAK